MKNNLVRSKVNTFHFICHVFVRSVLWLVLVCRRPTGLTCIFHLINFSQIEGCGCRLRSPSEPCRLQAVLDLRTLRWPSVSRQSSSHMWSWTVLRNATPWTKPSGGTNLVTLTVTGRSEVPGTSSSHLFSSSVCSEMVDCFNAIAGDPDCRVVVVSGAGKLFTAGGCLTLYTI